jgi:hypothetical protein
MQTKDTKSMSEVRLGGPLAVCTVYAVCSGVHNGEIADVIVVIFFWVFQVPRCSVPFMRNIAVVK